MVAMTVARQPRASKRRVGRGTGTCRCRLGIVACIVIKLVRSGMPRRVLEAVIKVMRVLDHASKP
jgi:hypothetical protein